MKRAIGYLRVSTAGQAEHGMGLRAQRRAVETFAAQKGYQLLELVEEAASGGVRNGEEHSWEHRPVLSCLIDRAQAGEFQMLIVARLDRLSRDYMSLTLLERRLQKHGVEVVSVAEENGDGPIAEFVRGQLALVAQLERAMILDRVSKGKAERKREGKHVHGSIPYGYRSAGEGNLEPVEEYATLVRRIFTESARDGWSAGRIARELNRDAIPSPQGKTWSPAGVRGILRNPVYAGERYGKKGAQPHIVSRRTWNTAQETLDRRRRRAD